jgi:hypothetical protein
MNTNNTYLAVFLGSKDQSATSGLGRPFGRRSPREGTRRHGGLEGVGLRNITPPL